MAKKPNIVFIMGDDIGITNLSCYSHGLVGYKTPNIDRLAKEGVMFTDYYAEQSCTAGRAAFCTGQAPVRSGLSKVGLPHAKEGIIEGTTTIAWALKEQGYRCGQFGKNHFGDAPSTYPTAHGFDEFYGVFYHLNAYQTPYIYEYPKDPKFKEKYGPRNLTRSWADGREEDMGELTEERMKVIDEEFTECAKEFMAKAVEDDEPFFLWHNTTHMHYFTYTKDDSLHQSGRWQSPYHDTMMDHDKSVGAILDELDRLGIADNTIVVYTTDNGPHENEWPDAATTPFRSEKVTNWEGAYRVPCLARFPGQWEAGEVKNGIVASYDWFPTFVAAAGNPDIKEQLKKGTKLAGQELKAHLDGYDLNDYLAGKTDESPRKEFIYFSDDGDLLAARYDNWKMHFMVQLARGTTKVWMAPFIPLRAPLIINLRTDPFERAPDTSDVYWRWIDDQGQWLVVPVQQIVGSFLETFEEFPPLQNPGSFTVSGAKQMIQNAALH